MNLIVLIIVLLLLFAGGGLISAIRPSAAWDLALFA